VNFERTVRSGRNMNMEIALSSAGRFYDVEELKNPAAAVSKIMDYERSLI